jgi:magnesium-transporting ATPase (P-type)
LVRTVDHFAQDVRKSDGNDASGSRSLVQTLPVSAVFDRLVTRPAGLTREEVGERQVRFGPNRIREAGGKPLHQKLLAHFVHLMALLLWVGGLIAFVAGLPQLGVAIWLVVLINGAFSFWQEHKAEKATEALRRLLPAYARVLRDSSEQRIGAEELVPGDLMLLAEGDHISADARLIDEAGLRVDQSTLTGESRPVRKNAWPVGHNALARTELPNMVFAGTNVSAGVGKGIVTATGMNTEFGKIAHLTQTVREELSPLQREMAHLTRLVTVIAVVAGVVFFVLAHLLVGMNFALSFIFMLGMIVAFVPEGLLPTVTLALAMGVQRMARRRALVKRLSAVETLGCTTVICTDKTGTLTKNEMTVTDLWIAGRDFTVTGVGYAPGGEILEHGASVKEASSLVCAATDTTGAACGKSNLARNGDLAQLLIAAGLCDDARLLPPNVACPRWTALGDPTEAALRVVALKGGIDLDAEARRTPRLRELPFDSRRKRMSTIHLVEQFRPHIVNLQSASSDLKPADCHRLAYVKGAPREMLSLCTHVRIDGKDVPMDDAKRTEIIAVNDEYARGGLRVLAVAMRALPAEMVEYTSANVERDLTFLGLMALLDPPRPEVSEAVERCHRAGIRIVMITGDYSLTAESIARRIGIVRGGTPRIINGSDLDTMDDVALKDALCGEVILARVAPDHKLRVVRALQEVGNIVAVTGDGVNDAPALKKADIGVAMGLAGTDVAKEAADIILTDDNFATIVNAVEDGRAVYANIKKFITYIFTSNTPEAVPFILFALSGGRIPLALNVMQILSIDLGTDIVPALALGAEPPEPGLMNKPPRHLKDHAISRSLLLRAYPWLGAIQSVAAMSAFYFMYWMSGYWGQWVDLPSSGTLYQAATAMTLAAVVATQIGNLFAQRTEHASVFKIGLFSNPLVWLGIGMEVALLLVIIYVPFFQWAFSTSPFPLSHWLFLLVWVPVLFVADEARKAIVRYWWG